jgi:hypothetical protein
MSLAPLPQYVFMAQCLVKLRHNFIIEVPLGKYWHRWKDNFKINLREMAYSIYMC